MAVGGTRVVQVTNIAPQATKDQMQTLFGFLGKIEDIRLYPTIRDVSCPVQSRICYIKFMDPATVGVAQHMTNTVFIDRALIVIPVQTGEIPDEYYALEMTKNGTIVPGLCPSEPKLPPNVVNTVSGIGADQVIVTTDPRLQENRLPVYPPLPANYDSVKVEEVRRTILVHNVDSSITADDIFNFFGKCGEIKYIRTCSRSSDNTSHMLVEFAEQPSIIAALKLNGSELKGKTMKLTHATQSITKPQAKSNEIAQREIEEAMSQAKEAQNLISAAMDPVIGMLSKDKRTTRRSRSRSRGRRRRSSRSRSRSRRSRSRHRTKRSVSRPKRSRSRDRRRRTRSRDRRRSRSRSRRSRTRSPRRSRSKSRYSSRRDRDRHRSKSKSRDRRSRERSKEKSRGRSRDRSKGRRSRDISKERRSRDASKERRSRERDLERLKDKDKERERESKEKRSDRESSVDEKRSSVDKRRSRSRSRYRSRSRDRKPRKEKRRSRSRGSRRRTPSPRRSRRRSRSSGPDRKKDKKDRKDKDRSPSRSKIPRNYDEEEKGFDSEKEKRKSQDSDTQNDKESSEKSDNMDISNSP